MTGFDSQIHFSDNEEEDCENDLEDDDEADEMIKEDSKSLEDAKKVVEEKVPGGEDQSNSESETEGPSKKDKTKLLFSSG